jgi:hypothetical protein
MNLLTFQVYVEFYTGIISKDSKDGENIAMLTFIHRGWYTMYVLSTNLHLRN